MAGVVMRPYFAPLLNEWVGRLGEMELRLFQDDIAPSELDVVDTYLAAECQFNGYGPVELDAWQPAGLGPDAKGYLPHDPVIFTKLAGGLNEQVFGFFLIDPYAGYLFYAEAFAAGPFYLDTTGQTLVVQPRISLRNDPG